MRNCDVLVVGSGVAGLSFAIKMALRRSDLKILIVTKSEPAESNTNYAQGGVAAVWDGEKDSYDKHIEDTLIAGDGLCNKEIVRMVVEEGPACVEELIQWGTRFDKEAGTYDLGMEGGHSAHRILHYRDLTGKEIQRALLEKASSLANIELLDHFFAVDIITQHHLGRYITRLSQDIDCYGCYALNQKTGVIETIRAKITVMASGGAGQVYKATTNPQIATGDGIAMFYRAKGRVENMEFVQFHPTSLFHPNGDNPVFLVTEALRGFGAVLKNKEGKTFMHKYDKRESLAPRDIVARAIDNEMKISGAEHMYLDARHLDKKSLTDHFPTIFQKCLSLGIDFTEQMIPVVPAQHYLCGGIKTNAWGQSSIQNLYACGECSSTGLHGANRLASNSLLEGLVFAHRIFQKVEKEVDQIQWRAGLPDWNAAGTTEPKEMVLITQSTKELKEIMSSYVGIVRSEVRLKRAFDRLKLLYEETEHLYNNTTISPQLCELRNLITIAYLITRSAGIRKESRGLHFNTDFPNKQEFIDNTLL